MARQYTLIDCVPTDNLMICQFSGELSRESILPLIAEVEEYEAMYIQGFQRYSDLSGITGLSLSAGQIHEIVKMRERTYKGPAVKSAIYSTDGLTYGMMRIYAALLDPTPITVEVYYQRKQAATWLGVSEDLLLVQEQ